MRTSGRPRTPKPIMPVRERDKKLLLKLPSLPHISSPVRNAWSASIMFRDRQSANVIPISATGSAKTAPVVTIWMPRLNNYSKGILFIKLLKSPIIASAQFSDAVFPTQTILDDPDHLFGWILFMRGAFNFKKYSRQGFYVF